MSKHHNSNPFRLWKLKETFLESDLFEVRSWRFIFVFIVMNIKMLLFLIHYHSSIQEQKFEPRPIPVQTRF